MVTHPPSGYKYDYPYPPTLPAAAGYYGRAEWAGVPVAGAGVPAAPAGVPERATVLVTANGDSAVVRPQPPREPTSWCLGEQTDSRWNPWCRPAVFLLLLVLLVLVFVMISGILLYFNYSSYKPKKTTTEDDDDDDDDKGLDCYKVNMSAKEEIANELTELVNDNNLQITSPNLSTPPVDSFNSEEWKNNNMPEDQSQRNGSDPSISAGTSGTNSTQSGTEDNPNSAVEQESASTENSSNNLSQNVAVNLDTPSTNNGTYSTQSNNMETNSEVENNGVNSAEELQEEIVDLTASPPKKKSKTIYSMDHITIIDTIDLADGPEKENKDVNSNQPTNNSNNNEAPGPSYKYPPEPCEKTYCAWGATCVNQQDGRALCTCPTDCPAVTAPVCGSDNRTYANHCQLRVASCQRKRNTRVAHQGECVLIDPCKGVQCNFGARCVPSPDGKNATCQCPERCANYGDHSKSGPVCGSDGRDYEDECKLRQQACSSSVNVTVKFYGKCDPCAGVECPEPEICQLDDNREPVCRCGDACPLEFTPVCGSDGKTYSNECSLRQESCRARRQLRIIYRGKCSSGVNPCLSVRCTMGEECVIDKFGIARCECLPDCEPIMRPVCSSDGRSFTSECEMQRSACVSRTHVQLQHAGVCGQRSACSEHTCHYGALCVERSGQPSCECPICPAEFSPVCGSDGISYGNECKLRLEACKHRREIRILYNGPCSGCENKKCEFYSSCESEGTAEGHCVCPETCSEVQDAEASVCGSNGVTYASECHLQVASCKMKHLVQVAYKGNCDLCQEVQCKFGARCEAGECVCPTNCEGSGSEPVCGSTMVTFPNECELQKTACMLPSDAQPLSVIFYGDCRERFPVTATMLPDTSHPEHVTPMELGPVTDSISVSVPEREACRDIHCDYEATCELGPDNFPRCSCQFDCSSPAVVANSKPVCASDMRIYPSLCAMKMEACQRQEELRLRPLDLCQGMEVKPCNGEQPLKDPLTNKELDCGNGPSRQDCPSGSYCHQTTRFAKCCQKANFRKAKPVEDISYENRPNAAVDTNLVKSGCEDSWFGCCPDGKTAAQGANNAGCPSVCGCNKLGSYTDSCDPNTQQCQCRPGVGGLKCDRCEPGYWGLPKISFGHQGCIPCGCSMFGSVREDCEQMTGRCVCKPGIQGQKCTICTSLNKILGPNGCVSVDASTPPPASCKDQNCYFGAICIERGGYAICECNVECPEERDAQKVCGSDGQTYLSECKLKMIACRTQKDIVVQAFGTCKDVYVGTDWPIRRYTPMHFTQPDDSNSPLSKSTRHLLSPDPRFYYERGSSLVRAPPLEGFREFNNIASPKMNRVPLLFHTKGENYAAAYRPTPATVHMVTALLGDLCSDHSDCSIAYSTCIGGACVCLTEFLESPDRQECINYNISTSNHSYKACSSSPCSLGSTCLDLPTNTFTCICSSNSTGPLCETEIINREYDIPSFNGNSFMRLHAFRAYHKFSVEIEFKSYSNDGILIYNQQKHDGSGDFVSLAIVKGWVEFRYNLGNGIVIIRSLDKIKLKQFHKVVIKRYHKDGMLKLDDGEDVVGQSQGNLKALDLSEDAYIGNIPTNSSKVYDNIGINQGFVGCVRKFKIGRRTVELHENLDDLIIQTQGIQDCSSDPCLTMPCQNGGSCSVVQKELFTCKCSPPYTGTFCEKINSNISDTYVPEFTGMSYIQLPQLQNVGKSFTIDIWFMARTGNGLILYNGQMKNGQGDFISLLLVNGHVQFRYNLGSGIANITSKDSIKFGKWYWVKIHRNGRHGSLEFDHSTPIQGHSGTPLTELNLELPFFIGSVPSWTEVHRLVGASKGFKGAIQRIALNGEPFPVMHKLHRCTTKTSDTEMCMLGVDTYTGHPCPELNNPCMNSGICVPHLNTYSCHCPNTHKGTNCETAIQDGSWPVKFIGKTFLLYRTRGAKNTNNTYGNYFMTAADEETNSTLVEGSSEFDDNSYVDYEDNYYNDDINNFNSFGRKSERAIKYEIMFRTTSLNGLLLWRSKNKSFKSEYLSVAIVDGFPELSYNLGKQDSFWAIRSPVRVNDGKWHTLYVRRRKRVGFISVDNSLPVRGLSYPGSIILNTNNKLWIGGSPNLPDGFPAAYYKGFQGCIKHIHINVKSLNLSRTHDDSVLQYCYDNDI